MNFDEETINMADLEKVYKTTIKVFRVEENGIEYSFYNVTRKEFFYVQSLPVFKRGDSKMFILDLKNCENTEDFNKYLNDFFLCDEIKVNAK